ncbi:proliferation-associated protein 2G4-like [Pollicipes pollicipes]|uniref:proliferation-associated protein 2G4-like n=1 Tax=Pollicipes pollicipes TaxID=41117 RepID=UPI001884A767|nr:proliferation-associated protein 2G4-like [Pollicipes pollicipes]
MASKEDDEQEKTIAEDIVVTKYQTAAEVANKALKAVMAKCVAGASVRDLCKTGDRVLEEELAKVYRKDKNLKKGIAFPTCVAVNHCIGHFSPLDSDPDVTLADGDLVKIDLGSHVDGFPAVVAHSLVVGADKENPVTGRKADVLLAAHYAFEAALRLVKPAQENYTVTDMVTKIAAEYKTKPIEGMLSHQLKQNVINGDKTIIQNPTEGQRKEHDKCDFEKHEVYGLDVLISTGDGTARELDARTTVYKKTDEVYSLKMKTSREFLSQVNKKCGTMPFNLRGMDDEKKAKLGVVECVNHRLIEPFQVLYEKPDQLVAQFKSTILLMPNATRKITGVPFDPTTCRAEHSIEDADVKSLLATPMDKKSANKKKKKPTVPEAVPVAKE